MNNRQYNYSIATLKVIFSFGVVCCHFWDASKASTYAGSVLSRICASAVPMFFIISFYLLGSWFNNYSKEDVKKRLTRLVYPQITWAILYYSGYSLASHVLQKIGITSEPVFNGRLSDFLWQVAIGTSTNLCPQMWFQFILILLTLLFLALFKLLKGKAYGFCSILFLLSLFLQYSGLNYSFFSMWQFEIKYCLGRLFEVLPFACIGLWLSLIRKWENNTYKLIMLILTLVIVANFQFFSEAKGFGYSGLFLIVYTSVFFLLFLFIPFNRLPNLAKRVIKFIARYTLGIYCVHIGIGNVLDIVVGNKFTWASRTIIECIIVYVLSLFVSWVIGCIPFKWARMLVE